MLVGVFSLGAVRASERKRKAAPSARQEEHHVLRLAEKIRMQREDLPFAASTPSSPPIATKA